MKAPSTCHGMDQFVWGEASRPIKCLVCPSCVCPVKMQAARTSNRLQFLLRQAEIFQHFAPAGTLEKEKAKGKKG